MKHVATRLLGGFGPGRRHGLVAGGALAFLGTAIGLADYTATQGVGTTFASIVISLKLYAAHVICDATIGETQCAAVKPASTAPSATDPALVVAISPNSVNANGQATAANSSPVVLPAAQVTADPCSLNTKTNFTISTTSGTLQIAAPSGSTQVYICSLFTIGATASIQNIVGGTGATCTRPALRLPSQVQTTAANGMSFVANGGFHFR